MIDIDKVKAAFAQTAAFCQQSFYQKKDGDTPAALCALSSLVSAAGVHPDLIGKLAKSQSALTTFFGPVLEVEYGVPRHMMSSVANAFDNEPNEFKGINKVLSLFEKYNKQEQDRPKLTIPDMPAFWGQPMTWTFAVNDIFTPITELPYDKIEKVVTGDVFNALGYKVAQEDVVDAPKGLLSVTEPKIIETVPADADFATYASKQAKQIIGSPLDWTVAIA